MLVAHQQLIHLAAEPLHFLLIDLSLLLQLRIFSHKSLAVLRVPVFRLPILLYYQNTYNVSMDARRQLHQPSLLRLTRYAIETYRQKQTPTVFDGVKDCV